MGKSDGDGCTGEEKEYRHRWMDSIKEDFREKGLSGEEAQVGRLIRNIDLHIKVGKDADEVPMNSNAIKLSKSGVRKTFDHRNLNIYYVASSRQNGFIATVKRVHTEMKTVTNTHLKLYICDRTIVCF